ncbi:MAG: hypothetical protein ACO3FI_05920 [Cyclobacteriaceae bacterium]
MKRILFLSALIVSVSGFAQEIKVTGKFLGDSVRIGEPVPYAVGVRYPSNYFILFADSLNDFSPFEYERKTWFPTITKNGISYDSAIYWLSSFEIDSIQYLSVPVLQIRDKDSLYFRSATDSIFFSSRVSSVPDSVAVTALPLKEDTLYRKVSKLFNYPFFLAFAGVTIVLLIVMWFVFGKRLTKWWKRRKLTKAFSAFESAFLQTIEKIKEHGGIREAESALIIWKRYLEELEGIPYTRYTTREIASIERHHSIREALSSIDKRIYGGYRGDSVNEYYTLKNFSEDRFIQKIEELKR